MFLVSEDTEKDEWMSKKSHNLLIGVLRWLAKEWVKACSSAIATIIIGYLAVTYRKCIGGWLTTKHSLNVYGWSWILALLLTASLSILVFWLVTRQRILYNDEADIKNILHDWWKLHCTGHQGSLRLTIDFDSVDRHKHLPKGSAAKFLPHIAEVNFGCSLVNKGKATMLIDCKGRDVPRRSGFLDDLPVL